jgi:hypothetical protein
MSSRDARLGDGESLAAAEGVSSSDTLHGLVDGTRIGRFVVLRDVDGRVHAVAVGSVSAVSEMDDGETVLILPGGRMVRVDRRLVTVVGWLDGRGPG